MFRPSGATFFFSIKQLDDKHDAARKTHFIRNVYGHKTNTSVAETCLLAHCSRDLQFRHRKLKFPELVLFLVVREAFPTSIL